MASVEQMGDAEPLDSAPPQNTDSKFSALLQKTKNEVSALVRKTKSKYSALTASHRVGNKPVPIPAAEPEKSKKAVPENKQPQKTNTFGRKTYRALKDYARRIKTYGHAPYHAVIDYALSPRAADPSYSPFAGQKLGQTNLPPPVFTVPIAVGYLTMVAGGVLIGHAAALPYVVAASMASGFVVGSCRGTRPGSAVMGAITGGFVGSLVGVIMGDNTIFELNLPQNLAASAFSKVPILGQYLAPPPVRPLCNPYTFGGVVHRC